MLVIIVALVLSLIGGVTLAINIVTYFCLGDSSSGLSFVLGIGGETLASKASQKEQKGKQNDAEQ